MGGSDHESVDPSAPGQMPCEKKPGKPGNLTWRCRIDLITEWIHTQVSLPPSPGIHTMYLPKTCQPLPTQAPSPGISIPAEAFLQLRW